MMYTNGVNYNYDTSYYNYGYDLGTNYNAYNNIITKKNNWWENWSISSSYETYEVKKKRKKEIKKEIDKLKTKYRLKAQIGGDENVKRKRGGFFHISIPNTEKFKDNIKNIEDKIEIFNKYPNGKKMDKFNNFLSEKLVPLEKMYFDLGSHKRNDFLDSKTNDFFSNVDMEVISEADLEKNKKIFKRLLDKIFNSSIKNIKDLEELTKLIPKQENSDEEKSWGGSCFRDEFKEIERHKQKIKFEPPVVHYTKESSLYRGRRLNPQYIKGVDYKVLQNKEEIKNKRQSILFLLDGSGSMDGRPYEYGINFIADFMQGDFDIKVLQTNGERIKDMTGELRGWAKNGGKITYANSGSEGFESLTSRYDKKIEEDYVVVITDMQVPSDAEDNLREFVKGKKHLVLSFGINRKFQGLNVRFVKNGKDMANVVSTITHNH